VEGLSGFIILFVSLFNDGVVPALTERHNREQFMHTSEQTSCEHSLITVKDPLKLFPSFRLFMAITFNYKGNMQSALIK